jgi:uncharacterized protein YjbJ (UPF0337 family)
MNRKQTRGAGLQVKGTAKELVGKVTRNRSLQAEGKLEKILGKAQKKAGDAHARSARRRELEGNEDP